MKLGRPKGRTYNRWIKVIGNGTDNHVSISHRF